MSQPITAKERAQNTLDRARALLQEVKRDYNPLNRDTWTHPKRVAILVVLGVGAVFTLRALYRKFSKQPQKRTSLAGFPFGLLAQIGTDLRLTVQGISCPPVEGEVAEVVLEESSQPTLWHFEPTKTANIFYVRFGRECNRENSKSLSMGRDGRLVLSDKESPSEQWQIKADTSNDKRFFLRNVGRDKLLEDGGAPLILEFRA